MELTNDFRVSAPPPEAWKVLTDLERIAPMLPGAQLQEVEGEEYRGVVKVKVGPITAQYKGTATFQERDESAGRVVLRASGRDTRGQGNASATITASLAPDGEGTRVSVVTDLTVTGKVAQFGRGVLADVSAKLIGQFVDALEADLQGGGEPAGSAADAPRADTSAGAASPAAVAEASAMGADATAPVPTSPESPERAGSGGAASSSQQPAGVRRIESPEPQPVDLLDAAGGSVARRLIPVLGGIAVLAVAWAWWRGRRR
jgi:carbon monoxide dehydrogenase subunit G